MTFASILLAAIADMIWGGQSARFSDLINDYRRVVAPFLVVLGLVFVIGLGPALISGVGYTAVRISGWRFKPAGNELFLGMEKAAHLVYAWIYGIGFLLIPIASHFIYGTNLVAGLAFWAIYAGLVTLPWAFLMFASRKLGYDLVPLKEAVWGGVFAAAAITFFRAAEAHQFIDWIGQ